MFLFHSFMRIGYERIAYANEFVYFIVTCLICVDPMIEGLRRASYGKRKK